MKSRTETWLALIVLAAGEPLNVRCEQTVEGLQRFADEPFFTFMRSQVFEPLGMDDTRADAGTGPIPDQANYYFPRFAADPRYGPQPPDEVDYSCFSGASALLSTPSDLVRFGLAIDGGRLLQPATVQLLQTSQRLASGQETGYGLGWDLETVPADNHRPDLASILDLDKVRSPPRSAGGSSDRPPGSPPSPAPSPNTARA